MKFLILVIIIFFYSCQTKVENKSIDKNYSEVELKLEKESSILRSLSYESEKILLLSETIKIPYDSLINILKIYMYETKDHEYPIDSVKFYSSKGLYLISKQFSYPKEKVASWIFSYKYGMLSKEQMEYEAIELYQQGKIDEQEQENDFDDDPIH